MNDTKLVTVCVTIELQYELDLNNFPTWVSKHMLPDMITAARSDYNKLNLTLEDLGKGGILDMDPVSIEFGDVELL